MAKSNIMCSARRKNVARAVILVVVMTQCAFSSPVIKSYVCPSSQFISPCRCTPSAMGTLVSCARISDAEKLLVPFKILHDYELARLLLSEIRFPVPVRLFKGLRVELLKITDATYQVTGFGPTFQKFETPLKQLVFQRSVVDFGYTSLGTMESLQEVNFYECTIGVLRKAWFDGMENLQKLRIDSSNITEIESGVFDQVEVEELQLVENGFREIRRDYLPRNSAIIDLRDNKLETLPDDIFSNMEKLTTVRLAGNRFKTIPEGPFKNLWDQLILVDFERNPLVCDETLRWLIERRRESMTLSGRCTKPGTDIKIKLSDLTLSDIETQ